MKSTKSKLNQKSALTIGLIFLCLLAVTAAILLVRQAQTQGQGLHTSGGISYDPGAVAGGWEGESTDRLTEVLNRQVEEGMINISMNTTPVFAHGQAEGNLMIVNEAVNRYPQTVEISRNDTGAVIYTSGAIPVGSKIEWAPLASALPAGTYECTAMFRSIDPDSGAVLGCAGAVIVLTVLG